VELYEFLIKSIKRALQEELRCQIVPSGVTRFENRKLNFVLLIENFFRELLLKGSRISPPKSYF